MITTKRLKIYPASDSQMGSLIAMQTVPELKEVYTQMLDGCKIHPEKREWYALWNIELKDGSDTLIGNLSFKGLDEDGTVEIGYGTNEGFENKGYMTEAVTATALWASLQNGVKQIEAEAEEDNTASIRVLEKSGFIPNGKRGEEGPRFIWQPK